MTHRRHSYLLEVAKVRVKFLDSRIYVSGTECVEIIGKGYLWT